MSSRPSTSRPPIYGLMAEFSDPNELIAAIRQARAGGYRRMDAYTPYPIEEVAHELRQIGELRHESVDGRTALHDSCS